MEDREAMDTTMDSAETRNRLVDHEVTSEDCHWAAFLHLAGFVGIVLDGVGTMAAILLTAVLWIMKKDVSPYLNDHGREALNFQVTLAAYRLIALVPLVFILGPAGLILVNLFGAVAMIMMALRGSRGEFVRYPMTIRVFNEA